MAKDINKYAQNIARARYATPSYTGPQRRATIDPTLFAGKTAAKGAPLASRPIEGGPALPSPKEYNAIIDAESGEDPNAPRVETQQPITQPGFDPRFVIQGGGPRIDLSGFFPERANPNYDPSKAIGGENVPYKPAGLFRSILGDPANRKNIEAQQGQAAEWNAESALAKRRAERKQDLEDEIALREKGPSERFAKTEARLTKAEEDAKAERERERSDRLAREAAAEKIRLQERQDRLDQWREENALKDAIFGQNRLTANRPRYKTIQTEKGGATVIDEDTGKPIRTFHPPGVGNIKDPITGKDVIGMVPGRWEEYELPTVPKNLGEGAQVDRTTGAPMGGPLPVEGQLPPGGGVLRPGESAAATLPENTAIIPRFMRGAGEAFGSAATAATDPLRVLGTDVYKTLFSSGAQQNPEVIKRMRAREAARQNADVVDYGPMF